MMWRRLLNVVRARTVEADIVREFEFHVAERTDELMAQGWGAAAAEREARRRLGHELVHREHARDADLLVWLDTLLGDVRYAFGGMRARPGHSAVLVLTLALGIGANVAVFSIVRSVLLGPLPVLEPERLVTVTERRRSSDDVDLPISGHEFVAWQEQNRSLERLALFHADRMNLTGADEPESIAIQRVSPEYFPLLGLRAALGRAWVPPEAGVEPLVVLSDGFWRRRFGADSGIVGGTITLDGAPFTVIGVMPPLPPSLAPDVWLPLDVTAEARAVGRHNLSVIGRLADGVTIAQAQRDLAAIAARLEAELPASNMDHRVHIASFREALVGEFRRPLLVLMGAVAFVLLIACANVANLLLARTAYRHREIAVRTALGATRWRIVRQLLIESVALAVVGGAAGIVLALLLVDVAARVTAVRIPLLETAHLHWQGFVVAAVASLLAGILIGSAPALRWARLLSRPLREHGATGDRRGRRMRAALVTAEVALTLMLLVGTGLLVNSFVRLTQVDPGFDTRDLAVVPVDLPASRYGEARQAQLFVNRALAELRSIPGVRAAGAVSHLPLGGTDNRMSFRIAGRAPVPPGEEPQVRVRVATPGYFEAMGIPLLRGRAFAESDARVALPLIRWYPQQPYPAGFEQPQAAPVAVISDAAAHRYWPNEDPIGQRIHVLFSPDVTIVGIVGDVRHDALDAPKHPHIYLAHNQEPWNAVSLVVSSDGAAPIAAIRERMRALDAALPIVARTMTSLRTAAIARPRFFMQLVGLFGALALTLAIVGIGGVVSYVVSERTREIGVRVTLGAQRREILSLIVREAMQPILLGVAIGIAGALLLTRFMVTLLFDVQPADPLTFAAVALLLVVVALLACLYPARRATRMDPLAALRVG
jgi:predicted permease